VEAEMKSTGTESKLKFGMRALSAFNLLANRHLQHFACLVILLFCAVSTLRLTIQEGVGLFSLYEGGYGDNYVYHTVESYVQTGQIYPDLRNPFELPSIYGPLTYVLLSLPLRVIPWVSGYLGLRLLILASFLVCLYLVASISRKLIHHRRAVPVSLLLAASFGVFQGSFGVFQGWPIQLRGDFPSILFALLAIRLLLSSRPWAPALAGAAAGFALQFKFTYVAAAAAGFLWLTYQRKWKPLIAFSLTAALTSVGVYSLVLLREPHMLAHIFALRSPVLEFRGVGMFLYHLAKEPGLLLGLTMVPVLLLRRQPHWFLLALYFLISFSVAAVTGIQAGGNINYFFECLFAITPFATLGVFWLRERTTTIGGVFLGLLIWGFGVNPAVTSTATTIDKARDTAVQNRYLQNLRDAFAGLNIFCTVPWASHLAPTVVIAEPFLLSYLERTGRRDSAPWAARIRRREFDLIVTPVQAVSWRGIPDITPKIRAAIDESYQPFCACPHILLFSRRQENLDSSLSLRFAAIGCRPVSCPAATECRVW
jgi:hypothetical protein